MKTKETRGITLIALVVTIIVLLILAGISISMLAGQNGILNRAAEAKEKNGKAQIKETARLAYAEVLTENLGKVNDNTILSAVIGKLEQAGYEVTTVNNAGSTYVGLEVLEIIGETGNNISGITLNQGDSTKIRVNLKMTEGSTKVYVKLDEKYYELTANSNEINISEEGINSIEGEKYTIQIEPTTNIAKMYIGDTEVKEPQTILSGTEITIVAGNTISNEDFKIKVLEKNVESIGNVSVIQKQVHAESITIFEENGKTTVGKNKTLQLKVTTTPVLITDKIEWSSSENSIATVNSTGLVTGISEGYVTITARTKDDNDKEYKMSTYTLYVSEGWVILGPTENSYTYSVHERYTEYVIAQFNITIMGNMFDRGPIEESDFDLACVSESSGWQFNLVKLYENTFELRVSYWGDDDEPKDASCDVFIRQVCSDDFDISSGPPSTFMIGANCYYNPQ